MSSEPVKLSTLVVDWLKTKVNPSAEISFITVYDDNEPVVRICLDGATLGWVWDNRAEFLSNCYNLDGKHYCVVKRNAAADPKFFEKIWAEISVVMKEKNL